MKFITILGTLDKINNTLKEIVEALKKLENKS